MYDIESVEATKELEINIPAALSCNSPEIENFINSWKLDLKEEISGAFSNPTENITFGSPER
jgi:hypothetical protein